MFTEEDDDAQHHQLASPRGTMEELETPARRSRIRCQPEMVFTVDQVRAIVEKAVQEREAELTQQYDEILNQKLGEQMQSFAKYHQAALQSRMAATPSCMSAPPVYSHPSHIAADIM